MTRYAVLADVHGNMPALEAVLADMRQHRVDGIVVAGDLTCGPHQIETTDLLRSLGSQMIQGNGENNLVRDDTGHAPDYWRTSRQWALHRWTYRNLDRATLDFIATLPEQLVISLPGTAAIRVVHGSPRDPAEGLCPDDDLAALELALAQIAEPVLVCGHTHIQWKWERDGRLAFNPGSVAGPLDGHVGAQYALLTWQDNRWQVGHRIVPYDLERIRTAFHACGLLAEGGALARYYLLSIETGQNAPEGFLSYAYRLAAEAGFENCVVVPDDIWDKAEATFNWSQ